MERDYFREYARLEKEHWWFKARLKILEALYNTFVSKSSQTNSPIILNAGAATGATSEMLNTFGHVISLEYDKECFDYLVEEKNINAVNASLTELPFPDNHFDAVCAFDVIEHIDDHKKAIQEIKRVLKPNGKYFLTVPAYMFLWSDHDDVNHHFRRYTSTLLKSLILSEHLKVSYLSYFNFFLFPLIAAARLIQGVLKIFMPSKEKKIDSKGINSSGIFNFLFYKIFISEKFFLRRKVRFPFGISLVVIGEKPFQNQKPK